MCRKRSNPSVVHTPMMLGVGKSTTSYAPSSIADANCTLKARYQMTALRTAEMSAPAGISYSNEPSLALSAPSSMAPSA